MEGDSMSMNDAHLQEEAAFADAEYSPMLGKTEINPLMFVKYSHPAKMWDWRQRAAVALGDLKDRKLLDFGCGQGEESAYFAKLGADVTGIDISEVGVRVARERALANGFNSEFQVMNCLEMSFPDDTFDVVHGMGILHHVGLADGLAEVKRVLKPGGRAVFLEPLQSTRAIESAKEWISGRYAQKYRLIPVTSGEENLKQADVARAGDSWSRCEVYLFHLLYRIKKLILPMKRWDSLLPIDAWLLRNLPFLRRYAGAAVIVLVK
jgi:2-polyprenyl-3-methyl-5-hydroxy-6-metoxy-1,4-benzoquinol methylase